MLEPMWLSWARNELGVSEIAGDKDNPRIESYWKIGNVALKVDNDEVPWCAAFACAALESVGFRSPRTPRARGFEPGRHCIEVDMYCGAIVVLSSDRGPSSGHVGFLVGLSFGKVHLLGGNQGNKVSIASFPASRVVEVLWPVTAPDPLRYSKAPQMSASGGTPSDR